MNILFLAPRMPLPADTGGKIILYGGAMQLGYNLEGIVPFRILEMFITFHSNYP